MKRSGPIARRTPLRRSQKPIRRSAIKRPSVADLLASGKVQWGSTLKKSTKPIRKRAKSNPGWVDVAMSLWDNATGERRCEMCDKWLGTEFSPEFYHHILHRGSYRSLKREPRNLIRLCASCHGFAHNPGIERMANSASFNYKRWQMLRRRMVALREEANGLNDH